MNAKHFPVLSILARVFDDGADEAMDEWRAWYTPTDWSHISRGLGVFIRQRLEAKDSGLIRVRPEARCRTCNGPEGISFNPDCPAGWAHRFVREKETSGPPIADPRTPRTESPL